MGIRSTGFQPVTSKMLVLLVLGKVGMQISLIKIRQNLHLKFQVIEKFWYFKNP
jgi:hypothetical protein